MWCQTKFRVKRQLKHWLESRTKREKKNNNNNNNKHEPHFHRIFEPFSLTLALSLFLSVSVFFIFHRVRSFVERVYVVWQRSLTHIFSHSTEYSKIASSLRLEVDMCTHVYFARRSNKTERKNIQMFELRTIFKTQRRNRLMNHTWHWFDQPAEQAMVGHAWHLSIHSRFIVAKSYGRQQPKYLISFWEKKKENKKNIKNANSRGVACEGRKTKSKHQIERCRLICCCCVLVFCFSTNRFCIYFIV